MQTSTGRAVAQARQGAKPSIRLSDIHKVMKARYGGPCRTADAERYLMAALPELLPRGRSYRYAVDWARSRVPALLEERGEDFIREAWIKVENRKRRNLTTDQLSKLLKVTDDEPDDLNLRCIPAASRNAKTRKAERKAKNARAEAARRLRNKPDLTPRSKSLATTKPWEEAGVSRSKWYEIRATERAAQAVEMPVLDKFVDTVSVAPSGRIRGHQIPLHPLQEQSGQVALGTDGGALNDNVPAKMASADGGWWLRAGSPEVAAALEAYPELADDLGKHLDAIARWVARMPERNRCGSARSFLLNTGRTLRATRKAAA